MKAKVSRKTVLTKGGSWFTQEYEGKGFMKSGLKIRADKWSLMVAAGRMGVGQGVIFRETRRQRFQKKWS